MTTDQRSPLDFPLPDEGGVAPPGKPGDAAREGSVLFGFGIGLACNVAVALLAGLAEAELLLIGIGVLQLAYLLPVWIVLRFKGLKRTALGIVILAALTFLLNAACFGVVVFLMNDLH